MLKGLDELSEHELKVEFEKAGLEGQFNDVECLIRLTIYLVKVGIDPYSFQFNVEEEIHKFKDKEDGCEALEEEPNSTTVSVSTVPSSWLADGISAEQSLVSFPATLPGGSSFISDNARGALLSSPMLADVVSADSLVTRMKTVDSSVISSVSSPVSSSRDVFKTMGCVSVCIVDLDGDHPQACMILKRKLSERESGELYQFQFESLNQKPVLWPPNPPEDSSVVFYHQSFVCVLSDEMAALLSSILFS